MPESMMSFYDKLALITLDFQFIRPGCGTTSSSFLSIYLLNFSLVAAAASPIAIIVPLIMFACWIRVHTTAALAKKTLHFKESPR